MSVESFEDAIQFYKAAEASLPMMSPVAADVFLKESLCYMYLDRSNEAIKYAINAYHLSSSRATRRRWLPVWSSASPSS